MGVIVPTRKLFVIMSDEKSSPCLCKEAQSTMEAQLQRLLWALVVLRYGPLMDHRQ